MCVCALWNWFIKAIDRARAISVVQLNFIWIILLLPFHYMRRHHIYVYPHLDERRIFFHCARTIQFNAIEQNLNVYCRESSLLHPFWMENIERHHK